jgi:gluconate 2-dehydrogenase gamma chain
MLTRRRFLECNALSAAAGLLAVNLGACRRWSPGQAPALAFLTPAELLIVSAACERILPRDDDPGAIDLGVPLYIDRALAGEDYRRQRDRFRAGLHALDVEALKRARKPFSEIASARQDDIIDDWQIGTGEETEFVRLLVRLTLEGAFGDPSYGGNRNGEGWRLVGFAPCEPHRHVQG